RARGKRLLSSRGQLGRGAATPYSSYAVTEDMGPKIWLVLVFTMMPALPQPLQSTVRVQVKTDARPVENADVRVSGGHSSKTGPDGVAVLSAPLGHVDVNVTKRGFFPASVSLDLDVAKEWQLEIELQPQEQQQQEITVYATRTDTRLQDSPLHVEVISQDEINEEMAMRPGDISMLLNELGGMRVQATSPALGASSVRVQGMRGRYTAFLSDGLPLFGQQGAGLGLLQIPPMDLGQV